MLINSRDIYWTKHVHYKMAEYNLSQSRVLRVLRFPDRIEKGIVPETIAVMKKSGSKKRSYEIWVMYQIEKTRFKLQKSKIENLKIKVISAWKYPGESPKGKIIYIPPDTLEFLNSNQK